MDMVHKALVLHVNAHQRMNSTEEDLNYPVDKMSHSVFLSFLPQQFLSLLNCLMRNVEIL
jgi:ABC-type uncharacterized transport system ATPase subunit